MKSLNKSARCRGKRALTGLFWEVVFLFRYFDEIAKFIFLSLITHVNRLSIMLHRYYLSYFSEKFDAINFLNCGSS